MPSLPRCMRYPEPEHRIRPYDTVPVLRVDELDDIVQIPGLGIAIVPRAIAHDKGAVYQHIGDIEVKLEPLSTTWMKYGYNIGIVQRGEE